MFGNLNNFTLAVNNDGNAVTEVSGGLVGKITFQAQNDGNAVHWRSGVFTELQWTLTSSGDGKTAVLNVKGSLVIGDHTAIFQKIAQ
jgi:hypothetical protein